VTADGSFVLAASQDPAPLLPRPGCYTLRIPDGPWAPVIFSSPHSGRQYDPGFLAKSRLDALTLRRSEDCYIDEIFAAAPAHGAPLLAAEFPRAWCDANREPWELDPAMFEDALPDWVNTGSPRVAAGLGTIARVVATGAAIYRGRLRFADAEQRIASCWEPYHRALAALIAEIRARSPACLLVDCHSMPAHACEGRRPLPDIVLGDAHGGSCATAITRHVEHFLVRRGYVVRRNDPYAGGYVTRFYGKPPEGTHAVQIEIARGLYMNESSLDRLPGLLRVSGDMADLAASLVAEAGRLMAS
jgi:N-formylglutamate amidohydrolase